LETDLDGEKELSHTLDKKFLWVGRKKHTRFCWKRG
jgi:hypothetical protein